MAERHEEDEIVKRFIWKKFLNSFAHSTQKSGLRTIIFDGFSGEGRYGEEWPIGIECYGTPLIALRVAVETVHPQNRSQSFEFDPSNEIDRSDELSYEEIKNRFEESSIKIYLVEKDEERFKRLVKNAKQVIMKYGVRIASCKVSKVEHFLVTADDKVKIGCHLINTSFEEAVLPELKPSDRMVSYIDPFDFKISFEKVQKLVGEWKEVFITSNVNTIQNLQNEEEMAELCGLPYEEFQKRLEDKGVNNITNRVELYEENLKEKTSAKYSVSFELRKKTADSSLFHVIYATHNEKGFKAMEDVMYRGTRKADFSPSDYDRIVKGKFINLKKGIGKRKYNY